MSGKLNVPVNGPGAFGENVISISQVAPGASVGVCTPLENPQWSVSLNTPYEEVK